MRPAPALLRVALAAALLTSFAPPPTPAAADPWPLGLNTTSTLDASATSGLRAAADAERVNAGHDPLFVRAGYGDTATRIATAIVDGDGFVPPSDDAPYAHSYGTTDDFGYPSAIAHATRNTINSMSEVLRYPLHTDGGWAVVSKRLIDGRIAYGVALVVGWPAPTLPSNRGCSTNGYCWSNGGLHRHLPWTRNTVRWYLSTSNLPTAGESLVKSAIAKMNAVGGFGADLVYGGKTTATSPTPTRRFVIVWGSDCSAPNAIGCAISSTQGTHRLIFQSKVVMSLARYRSEPTASWWIGTLMHEIAHASGLTHYDKTYNGYYQLMRSSNGPDTLRRGDGNGLRRVAPGGVVSGSVTPVFTGTAYRLLVRTANSGLGGIRSVRTQCTDSTGAWRNVGLITGRFDTRATEREVGTFTPPGGGSSCRAIIRSKTRTFTTAAVTVRG